MGIPSTKIGQPVVIGRVAKVAIQMHNTGSRTVRGLRMTASTDAGMKLATGADFGRWPPIRGGRLVRRTVAVTPTNGGAHELRLRAESAYGSPEATVRLRAIRRGSSGLGSTLLLAGLLSFGALTAAFVLVRLRSR